MLVLTSKHSGDKFPTPLPVPRSSENRIQAQHAHRQATHCPFPPVGSRELGVQLGRCILSCTDWEGAWAVHLKPHWLIKPSCWCLEARVACLDTSFYSGVGITPYFVVGPIYILSLSTPILKYLQSTLFSTVKLLLTFLSDAISLTGGK